MLNKNTKRRADTASRKISATPQTIYEAFLNAEAVVAWRPPQGMKCHIFEFNPRPNGTFKMSFDYVDLKHEVAGKTSNHADVFTGQFIALVPNKRIVEMIEFETDDPAFKGKMTITTILEPSDNGTEVTFLAENVPPGIKQEDHYKGMISTLDNLAAFTEAKEY
jgi:uncharacterized protein YndB with AHSA1/START domain